MGVCVCGCACADVGYRTLGVEYAEVGLETMLSHEDWRGKGGSVIANSLFEQLRVGYRD